ncbi:MAG: aminodeoxychorismate synthase component I [Planctomycetes bacterium]|nr:aminodeoxychorismate synthase component I [Planctomycetota bacterium]
MSRVIESPRVAPHVEPVTGVTAWEVCQRLAGWERVVFFDSASPHPRPLCQGERGDTLGRYSYVTADPAVWLTSHQGWVSENGRFLGVADPLMVLADRLADFSLEPLEGLPPFQGGAAGLFGYDLCHHIEVLPRPAYDDFGIPDLAVGIYDWVIAFDHSSDEAWLISTGYPETEPHRREQRARRRADEVKAWLDRRSLPSPPGKGVGAKGVGRAAIETPQFPSAGHSRITSNFDKKEYLHTIARAIEYTHAGDCFQVNIAQRLMTPAHDAPLDLYAKLRERNPAPFAGYFDLGDHTLLSASPERFLRVDTREVETRPIKGTRPRGQTPEEDRRLAHELLTSAKDRAENVMIVDLLRNDLGRVCEYGSVRVEALCRLESYQFVHHLVSEVRGRLREGMGPIDLLRAAFPGGSVTGAPKIRAMEIIAELENTARGPYCGSLGWIGFDGGMDTNLLIRTMVYGKGWLHFSVGGGIVADSDPEQEYAETWHKAQGLLRALGD